MAESTLSLKLTDIQQRLGVYAGWGRGTDGGDAAWTSMMSDRIGYAVKAGLQRFYYPAPAEGQAQGHAWGFLRPTATLALAAGQSSLPLPDDFGYPEGAISLVSSSGVLWGPLDFRNEGELDARYAQAPAANGRPAVAAVRWLKPASGAQGQRAQLYVWPLADTAYSLRFQYAVLPDYLTSGAPYAYGGAAHSDTILESCLAALELELDGRPGPHAEAFAQRLAASISLDRRNKFQTLGYNADRSDGPGWARGDNHVVNPVSYKGVTY